MALRTDTDILRSVTLFKALDRRHLELIALVSVPMQYQVDDIICDPHLCADAVYIILKGSVRLDIFNTQHVSQVFNILKAGGSFGETDVLNGTRWSFVAKALEPTEVLLVPRTEFLELLRQIPDLSYAILKDLARRVRLLMQCFATMEA